MSEKTASSTPRISASTLARLQRRTAELEALFSTARELVRLRDVDEILRRLVQRAHELMGTDVTYLSEIEPGGHDLRVRHSAGTVTPEFRDLLVPAGFGLASKVATTRAPAWVARYETMQEAPHDPSIDSAVAAEGLVSFLGVPLAVGDEVLGALFASNRFGHDFTPDQVLLLSAFADHAAAVLHTARILEESAAATARAEEAVRELEKHLTATELASAIHEELTSAVMSGGTVVDLVATVAERLGRRVWALDASGRPLQVQAGEGGQLPPRAVLTDATSRSQASGHAERVESRGQSWLVVAILGADRVVGAIVAEEPDYPADTLPDNVGRRTLERAAHVAALVSFKRDAVATIRADRRARYLLDLMGGAETGGADAGGDDGDPQLTLPGPVVGCAVIDLRNKSVEHATSLAVKAVGDDGLVAQVDHRIIVGWAVPDAVAHTERVRQLLADGLREPLITAVAINRVAQVGEAVERATRDLRFLGPLGIAATTVSSDAFAPYHAMSSAHPDAADHFVTDLLGAVLEWDANRGTHLFDTLAAYFTANESPNAAAIALHVHKNTVQQRLDRIQSLLPGEWSDAEYRFRVQAAVRMEGLRRAVLGTTVHSAP